jgi:2-dehydro-3-deoxyphosphogluconate aldolase/(4S)-4-hydroxy-2-oxoglutarate aldolase
MVFLLKAFLRPASKWRMDEVFPSELQKKIESPGVIAVVVIEDADKAVPLSEALLRGGITSMELTLRTDAALKAVEQIADHVPEMVIGCGTVLSRAQLDAVIHSGAYFAVSPGLNTRVLEHAIEKKFPFAPGISSASDIEVAQEHGCRLLKFFPCETSGGLRHLKVLSAPFQHLGIKYIPLGGINPGNLTEYLGDRSLIAAVGGSWLAPKAMVAEGDWAGVEKLAREAVGIVKQDV